MFHFPFRCRDELTGKWVRRRYLAEGMPMELFPFRSRDDYRPQGASPPAVLIVVRSETATSPRLVLQAPQCECHHGQEGSHDGS